LKNKLAAAASVLGLGVAITMSAGSPSNGQATAHHHMSSDAAVHFKLQRSTGVVAANCLTDASASVTIKPVGQVEHMTISAHNLVPNSEYDVFVIQLPNAPFGVSWYQGDLESDAAGDAIGHYAGRFSIETFAVAPGVGPNAQVFPGDGAQNVASPPIHEYHVGVWFGSPATAVAAGCPNTQTPFNGAHNAGIQALSTKQFDDLHGPLRQVS
jgi:hypothetical protein